MRVIDKISIPTLIITAADDPFVPPGPFTDPVIARNRNITLKLTRFFNITGHPAVTVPCGATPEGLPVGAQLVGRHGQTVALLQLARALEPAKAHTAEAVCLVELAGLFQGPLVVGRDRLAAD